MALTETVYLGLGSDLGDRERFLAAAISQLESVEGLEIIATSALYITEPKDMPAGAPPFLNQVLKAEYQYPPEELLHALEKIELELGRTDKGELLPRTIDIDIILFGDRMIDTDQLTVPHQKMLERPFVLIPMLQIDPDIVHPASGKRLADFVTPASRDAVQLYKDHVARQF